MTEAEFVLLPDLASRAVGGSVMAANDELFAERENLIKPEKPVYTTYSFGHKGQVYDGWETRRRRGAGHDWAMVRLGLPGIVRGVIVDTSFFRGNYPPEISIEASGFEGYPTPEELAAGRWVEIVPRVAVSGDHINDFPVEVEQRFTHVRLNIYPDGGVARLRVHGEAIPDPRLLVAEALDLGALENGAAVTDCSNRFYSPAVNLILPGQARLMGEGWETARRRDGGNDWVEFALAGPGTVRVVELDTSYFIGNAPGSASVRAYDRRRGGRPQSAEDWIELLGRTRLQPDTRHRFRLGPHPEVTDVRLDVYPDGGMARFRLHGKLTEQGHEQLAIRWYNLLPEGHARRVLEAAGVADPDLFLSARPVASLAELPARLLAQLSISADVDAGDDLS